MSVIGVPVVLLGPGGVGRAWLRQLTESREGLAARRGMRLDVVAVADSTGALRAPVRVLDDAALDALRVAKAEGAALADLPEGRPVGEPAALLDRLDLPPAVVVDCTATASVTPALVAAVDRGWSVALANKIPLTGSLDVFEALTTSGRARWEATVGSGVPVIATLQRLLDAEDRVARIAGTFSGSLNFVVAELRQGHRFGAIVHEARARGFFEPDPRVDLGGVDMARKALILARMLGWPLSLEDVALEGLYPAEMDALSVDAFVAESGRLDGDLAHRVAAAEAEGAVLRYAAEIEGGACRVGPVVVPTASPLGRLQGTDNLIEYHTRWYAERPLVLQGRGAGVDATAAGVMADVVALAARIALR